MPGRPTIAHIDLGALSHNLAEVRVRAGGRKVMAIVKANAYGHGSVETARRLEADGIDMLGVALVEEGAELRDAGINTEILVLGGIFEDQADGLVKYKLTPAIYTAAQAESFSKAAAAAGIKMSVHVKVDTGMGRIGAQPAEAVKFVQEIANLPGLRIEGLMTHLSDVSARDKSFAEFQISEFRWVIDRLKATGVEPPHIHAAASAAVIDFGQSLFTMVRPGIMLYGCYPAGHMQGLVNLRPVMSLKTQVMHLKWVEKGKPISYGRTFTTARTSLIATLPIGYADGLSRALSNIGNVLIRGKRCPIVGTVCMDMAMVDVTDLGDVAVHDEAVVIGRQGDQEITADEVADRIGTISYEVLCGISARVKREY